MHRLYHYSVHELSKFVLRYIRKQDLLSPGDRVGVAVSGGADSVALLRILLELQNELGIVLSVVHLNHCLRGAESDGDEQFVRELAVRYELPFFSSRCDVQSCAKGKKLSVEAAARELRYDYFKRLLQNGDLNKLATAHTLDDQAETVLLKLTRGAGTRGLAGIFPRVVVKQSQSGNPRKDRELAIVRPLLSIQRSNLEQYLAKLQQPWREDSSNAQLHHTRNRIRHVILPRLCADVNPRVRQTLAEVADIARGEEEFWQQEVQRCVADAWSRNEQGGTLRLSALNRLPLALRRRVVRAVAEILELNLEFQHVEEVLSMLESARTVLPNGWTARRTGDFMRFERGGPSIPEDYEYELPVPGCLAVPEAEIILTTAAAEQKCETRPDRSDHALDPRFAGTLIVRNWRAGDRFWPANSKEPKKVKELLQDRHITGEQKKRWPVIASGKLVVWMRGFGIAHGAQSRDGGVLIRDEAITRKDQNP